MHHTEQFGLGFDTVDALTGPAIGRPKSATYRTADVVGLDTMAHVIKTMADTLPDDPWHKYFKAPVWLQALIDKGALGQKTGAGFYRKAGKDIVVLDIARAGLPRFRAEGVRRGRRHPRDQGPCREVRQAARLDRSTGPVPVGDLPRPVPLQRLPPGRYRRDRARRGLRDPLGLWLEARPLRDLAGRRLAAGGRLDRRGHQGRQGHERRAVAGMGHRRPQGRAWQGWLVLGQREGRQATLDPPGLQAPAVPGSDSWRAFRPGHDGLGKRRRAPVAPWRRCRHPLVQDQDAYHQRLRARRYPARGRGIARSSSRRWCSGSRPSLSRPART